MSAPTRLRVEHLDDPLGLTVSAPRLSWCLPPGTARQLAYRLRAGEWDSGRVVSDRSLLVPYAGPALRTGQRVDWTVKVWTDEGESDWSETAWWEMGLLSPADWVARWIVPAGADQTPSPSPHPAWHLRGTSALPEPVERARLYVTAHGIYEFFINDNRVGDLELTPGFTSYWSTLQVQTFDVTDLLVPGENVFGAIVSGGWLKWTRLYREIPVGLLAQVHVYGTDGSLTCIGTGPDWTAAVGAVRTSDLKQGQVVDFGKNIFGWCTPGAARDGWARVKVKSFDLARLKGSPAPPVRRVQELRPVAVARLHPDRQIVDLGQNINGWVRLTDLGPPGTTITLTHGEVLDAAGDVTIENLMPAEPERSEAFQQDQVTSAGHEGEYFEPRHTTHGFRHIRVEGHPSDLSADDVTGVVVHTDLRRTGWFECSDDRINRLHEAAVWSFRGNACDIPTDCPTRERAGWTGDWQIFVPTAAFLYDVAGFTTKWLRDLAADQRPEGVVWHCAPNPERDQFHPPGSAGWGDAAVIVPWEIYRAYGDRDLLDQQWPSMTAWIDYAARAARERRNPSRSAAKPVPAQHERYLWDTGFHWGEWLEPDMIALDAYPKAVEAAVAQLRAADPGHIATAYLHYSARLLGKIARILDRHQDAVRYQNLASAARAAWQAEFLHDDGTLMPATQASYVRALALHLVPEQLRPRTASHLVDLIRKADTHLNTGFLATPYLLPVLADTGHLDVAYELLFQDTEPSWLNMIDRGATTIWEHWSGLDENGQPNAPAGVGSLNHYSKGAVISFLHRYVAGIQLLDDSPAYRHFRIAPKPARGLNWAHAVHDSPYGRIETCWHIQDDQFVLEVTVPPGATAEVRLPDGQTLDAHPGTKRYKCSPPWQQQRRTTVNAVY